VLVVGTLQKRVLIDILQRMSDDAQQKIDYWRSYLAFVFVER